MALSTPADVHWVAVASRLPGSDAPEDCVNCTEVRRPLVVVTVTGASSATPTVPLEGVAVTAAARRADKSAAAVGAEGVGLCGKPQAENAVAAINVASPIVAACLTSES